MRQLLKEKHARREAELMERVEKEKAAKLAGQLQVSLPRWMPGWPHAHVHFVPSHVFA